MGSIIENLGLTDKQTKNVVEDKDLKKGDFFVLNVATSYGPVWTAKVSNEFWKDYNEKFIQQAIEKGYDIVLPSIPNENNILDKNDSETVYRIFDTSVNLKEEGYVKARYEKTDSNGKIIEYEDNIRVKENKSGEYEICDKKNLKEILTPGFKIDEIDKSDRFHKIEELTGFGKEYYTLLGNDYMYEPFSGRMVKGTRYIALDDENNVLNGHSYGDIQEATKAIKDAMNKNKIKTYKDFKLYEIDRNSYKSENNFKGVRVNFDENFDNLEESGVEEDLSEAIK